MGFLQYRPFGSGSSMVRVQSLQVRSLGTLTTATSSCKPVIQKTSLLSQALQVFRRCTEELLSCSPSHPVNPINVSTDEKLNTFSLATYRSLILTKSNEAFHSNLHSQRRRVSRLIAGRCIAWRWHSIRGNQSSSNGCANCRGDPVVVVVAQILMVMGHTPSSILSL